MFVVADNENSGTDLQHAYKATPTTSSELVLAFNKNGSNNTPGNDGWHLRGAYSNIKINVNETASTFTPTIPQSIDTNTIFYMSQSISNDIDNSTVINQTGTITYTNDMTDNGFNVISTSQNIFSTYSNVLLNAIPTYYDNTEAISGGLSLGSLYKTPTGEIRIVISSIPYTLSHIIWIGGDVSKTGNTNADYGRERFRVAWGGNGLCNITFGASGTVNHPCGTSLYLIFVVSDNENTGTDLQQAYKAIESTSSKLQLVFNKSGANSSMPFRFFILHIIRNDIKSRSEF